MRLWYDFDAILLRVEHLWRGALKLLTEVLPSWALPTLENREKGKGWSKNALLLTIAVLNASTLKGYAGILAICFLALLCTIV